MFCNLYNFSDIADVEFFAVKSNGAMTFNKPLCIYEPVIRVWSTPADINPQGLTTSLQPANYSCKVDGICNFHAHINEMSGELAVESNTALASTKFRCTLTYNIDCTPANIEIVKNELVDLQYNNYHMRITYISGDQHIVRCPKDAWSFSFKENKGVISVTIVVENLSGAQRVQL